jgi:hypothetical protein
MEERYPYPFDKGLRKLPAPQRRCHFPIRLVGDQRARDKD